MSDDEFENEANEILVEILHKAKYANKNADNLRDYFKALSRLMPQTGIEVYGPEVGAIGVDQYYLRYSGDRIDISNYDGPRGRATKVWCLSRAPLHLVVNAAFVLEDFFRQVVEEISKESNTRAKAIEIIQGFLQ